MRCVLVGIGVIMTLAACGGQNQPSPNDPASTSRPAAKASPDRSSRAASTPDPSRAHGRLPPELIQQVVRAHFDGMRRCYEAGLARSSTLKGKIAVSFVIARDGSVSSAIEVHDAPPSAPSGFAPGGPIEDTSQLQHEPRFPDANVIACVVARFAELHFPQPDGGTVTVVYPIIFSPEGEK